jgi:DNA-binding transcriptional LysR family regulator
MLPFEQRAVPEPESTAQSDGSVPDWASIRIFLEIVRRGSFRSASEHLRLSFKVLRKQIGDLEQQLGVTLLTRHVDGVRATPEGEEILGAAREMELASFKLIRARDRTRPALSGEVRLSVTEGLGTFWLAPRLVQFMRPHPRLRVDMSVAAQSADILRLEADISVQLSQPTSAELKIVKLGRLHLMPFAGTTHVETYGLPKTIEELAKHRLVLNLSDGSAEHIEQIHPGLTRDLATARTNVSSVHYWLIAKGAGVGFLPTFMQTSGLRLVPIDLGIHFHVDVWLVYHPDASRIPRVRRTIDWVIASFDPKKFPWFGDEFVHPRDLPVQDPGTDFADLLEGVPGAGGASRALSPVDVVASEVTFSQRGVPVAKLLAAAHAPIPAAEAVERRKQAIAEIRDRGRKRGQRIPVEEIKSWIEEGRT